MVIPVLVLLLGLCSGRAMAGDIEEPRWRLLEKLDEVELRYYETSIQARTTLTGDGETTAGFRRLAGFIFGDNSTAEKIAMTAPVQETLQVEQPVMAFTMPVEYSLDQLPAPSDPRVTLVEVPAKAVAVIRFSGWATRSKVASKTVELVSTLEKHAVETLGAPSLNQYNPPWTPPFLRRNEIMVEVSGPTLAATAQ